MLHSMRALVTGANGHIGSRIVRQLLEQGHEVRGLVRVGSDLRSLSAVEEQIDLRVGDLLDKPSLRSALRGCTHLFHTATRFSHQPSEAAQIHASAVEGTGNLLREAAAAGTFERIVHTSSCATIGSSRSPTALLDESHHAGRPVEVYRRAKVESEALALSLAGELELPLVVVNPAVVLGPGDHRPTPSNRVVLRYLQRGGWIYWRGGRSHVDADDLARGHLLAAERGRVGERYILGGRNITIYEAANILSKLTGSAAPRLRIGRGPMWALALALEGKAWIGGGAPAATRAQALAACGRFMYYSSAKAENELGYTSRDADEVFVRAVAWFLVSGLAPPERRERTRAFFQAVVGDPPEATLVPSFFLAGGAPFSR